METSWESKASQPTFYNPLGTFSTWWIFCVGIQRHTKLTSRRRGHECVPVTLLQLPTRQWAPKHERKSSGAFPFQNSLYSLFCSETRTSDWLKTSLIERYVLAFYSLFHCIKPHHYWIINTGTIRCWMVRVPKWQVEVRLTNGTLLKTDVLSHFPLYSIISYIHVQILHNVSGLNSWLFGEGALSDCLQCGASHHHLCHWLEIPTTRLSRHCLHSFFSGDTNTTTTGHVLLSNVMLIILCSCWKRSLIYGDIYGRRNARMLAALSWRMIKSQSSGSRWEVLIAMLK